MRNTDIQGPCSWATCPRSLSVWGERAGRYWKAKESKCKSDGSTWPKQRVPLCHGPLWGLAREWSHNNVIPPPLGLQVMTGEHHRQAERTIDVEVVWLKFLALKYLPRTIAIDIKSGIQTQGTLAYFKTILFLDKYTFNMEKQASTTFMLLHDARRPFFSTGKEEPSICWECKSSFSKSANPKLQIKAVQSVNLIQLIRLLPQVLHSNKPPPLTFYQDYLG